MTENTLLRERNTLFLAEHCASDEKSQAELQFLQANFCGRVVRDCAALASLPRDSLCFLTGDIASIGDKLPSATENVTFLVIRELSRAYEAMPGFRVVDALSVPLNVHNVGVFVRRFFNESDEYFARIEREHAFQFLTESTHTQNVALRKGIYLSEVTELQGDARAFHLLRCSSNLQGPTDNFRATDRAILRDVNAMLPCFFQQRIEVNHVLAQIYYNGGSGVPSTTADGDESLPTTQKKATIKRHSDKTKDMPAHGVIAFGTFYDFSKCDMSKCSTEASGDVVYRGKHSLLTEIEFVLKRPSEHPHLAREFRVTMLPNSLLVIALDTNRLYTHEIKPSILPVERIPTRLGYVMRCSTNRAVHRNGQTFMVSESDGSETPLHRMCPADSELIKSLYRNENATEDHIVYGKIYSSFNEGDYLQPLL